MLTITIHGDLATVVAHGPGCCEEIQDYIDKADTFDIVDRTHYGVSCCVRLLAGYSLTHDCEHTARGGQL